MKPPRYEASKLLHRFLEANEIVDQESRQQEQTAPLTRELILGCYRHLSKLDWLLNRMVDRKPDTLTKSFILTGIYELLFLDGTPDHAVVHETMEGCKKQLKPGQQKFLNAILRRCCRERESLLAALETAPAKVQRSHPGALVEQWSRHLSVPEIDAICAWNNTRAPITLRIAPGYGTPETYLKELEAEEIDAVTHPFYPEQFVELKTGGVPIRKLPGFEEGAFYVQDPSTVHAPAMLDAKPEERVLDLCAAPGGKTIILAEAMQGKGTLIAVDKQGQRIDLMKSNLSRMRQTWVKTMKRSAEDLLSTASFATNKFDAILLDAPCSNTGVLRRRPEARWRYSVASVKQLNNVQGDLLGVCAQLLKPGGRLVYSTCSIDPAENEGMLERWLKYQPKFEITESETIVPGERQCDGGYAACLRSK